jgi:hypothetical protein
MVASIDAVYDSLINTKSSIMSDTKKCEEFFYTDAIIGMLVESMPWLLPSMSLSMSDGKL